MSQPHVTHADDGRDSTPRLGLERVGHVLVLTINRPERRNAIDLATAVEIEAALDEYEADDQLRCAVITGSNGYFCAGQDLAVAAAGEIAITARRGGFGILQQPPTKPLIAAVEGFALAGGLEICLASDMIVAAAGASFGLPEASRGLFANGGALFRLPKRIPYHFAVQLALTGDTFTSERLHELGLVNVVTDPGQALAGAMDLADRVARSGPVAVRAAKAVLTHAYDWPEAEAWERQRDHFEQVQNSEDLQEGLSAFLEKRSPEWRGR
jgi:enoyl-CoA hydratase